WVEVVILAYVRRLQSGEHGGAAVDVDHLADEAVLVVDGDQDPFGHGIEQYTEAAVAQHRPPPARTYIAADGPTSTPKGLANWASAVESADRGAQGCGGGQPTKAASAAARSGGNGAVTVVRAPVEGWGKVAAAACRKWPRVPAGAGGPP